MGTSAGGVGKSVPDWDGPGKKTKFVLVWFCSNLKILKILVRLLVVVLLLQYFMQYLLTQLLAFSISWLKLQKSVLQCPTCWNLNARRVSITVNTIILGTTLWPVWICTFNDVYTSVLSWTEAWQAATSNHLAGKVGTVLNHFECKKKLCTILAVDFHTANALY